ncbi:MAG: SIS domain-containing protein [Arenicellales bacterium WSBS_2016_MAG_OTU3]
MQETQMRREINEIPDVLSRQIAQGLPQYIESGRHAAHLNPRGFVTCARGTSDHAATYFKYVMETRTGLPVASIGPSIASVYDTRLKLNDFICLTISQSGGSPDLLAFQKAAKAGGAVTYALLNDIESPVGHDADHVIPILAGPEKAVAATKSFVGSLFAILGFAAGFTNDAELEKSLRQLVKSAQNALGTDWSSAAVPLARARSVFTIGRGPGMAIAAEAALKLKETCRIHAEAFSSAEVLHGPVVLAERKFVALAFQTSDLSQQSVTNAVAGMSEKKADVFTITHSSGGENTLLVPEFSHHLALPMIQAISFYNFVEILAGNLKENADAPEGLRKVTETV